MAQQTKTNHASSRSTTVRPETKKSAKPQAISEETVTFTSWDGTVREVGALPDDLGHATALAGEKTLSKIWGTAEEDAACQDMRKEI